jgi:hypothetical protein
MQRCSLIMKKRKRGPDVWLLRWSDKSDSGRRIYRKRVIGTVEEFVDTDSARRAVASLVDKINGDNPRISLRTITMSTLCSHFERCELAQGNTWRSHSTKKCYAGYLKRRIVPQWGKYELSWEQIKFAKGYLVVGQSKTVSRGMQNNSAELLAASGLKRIRSLVPGEVWRDSPGVVRLSVWEASPQ